MTLRECDGKLVIARYGHYRVGVQVSITGKLRRLGAVWGVTITNEYGGYGEIVFEDASVEQIECGSIIVTIKE